MALMGLDIGSTGCKAMVFSDDGKPLSYSYSEYETVGSVYETNCDIIWKHVRNVLTKCALGHKNELKALSISSFGESFVPIDRAGNVLMNTLLYTDPRGTQQCERYKSQFGEQRIMEIAGVKPHPMYSLAKLGYIHDEHQELFNRTYQFLLIESFIIFKLTNESYIDYSLAARTMAFDVTKKKWSKELLALAELDEEKLPKAVPCGTAVAKVIPAIANELGLPLDLMIVTGGHDQVCAATGAGITKPGLAIDGTGTVECITPVFDKPILTKQFLDNNYACVPHSVDGMYVTYAFNFTGGSILKWYRDNFAKYETMLAKEKGVSVYALLDELGAKNPTDLIVVPHFAGSATPDMNEDARGAFMGLRFDTDAPTLYRALIEGVTYEMAYNIEFLEAAGIKIEELRAVGGGAKSSYWLDIKANITGCRIIPLDIEEAGITGTAILAGVASGIYKNIDEALEYFVKPKTVIEPDKEQQKIYSENFQRYKEARKLISKLYKED
jgi:xylulokinase